MKQFLNPKPTVGLVRLSGVISTSSGLLGKPDLSIEVIEETLKKAFELKRLKAVAIVINSPGGSPVQSELIYRRIRQLAEEKEVPVLAFVEDVAASGGYWLACAGDEIFAMGGSIVGSIGVISSMFGFQELIKKWGIERRVYTQGKRKNILDSFLPVKEEDVETLKELQSDLHEEFKSLVRERRKGKIKPVDEELLFSGLFWTAAKAKQIGLVDEIGDYHQVLRQRYGKDVEIKRMDKSKGLLSRVLGKTKQEHFAGTLVAAVEERLLRSRYGL